MLTFRLELLCLPGGHDYFHIPASRLIRWQCLFKTNTVDITFERSEEFLNIIETFEDICGRITFLLFKFTILNSQ